MDCSERLKAPSKQTAYVRPRPSCSGSSSKTGCGDTTKRFTSEIVGTCLFVLIAQCGLTSFELLGTQNDVIGKQLGTLLTNGLAFALAAHLTLVHSDAHLNPAYTFATAVFRKLSWPRAFMYMLAQYTGALVASVLLHAIYSDKLQQRHTEGLLFGANSTQRAHGNILSTGKFFTSYPPTEVSLFQLTISYMLAATQYVLLLAAIHYKSAPRLTMAAKPAYLGAALIAVQAAFAANGGPVLNPAQDFSPRLYISMTGWGAAAFNLHSYTYWWLCGILAPHIGALFGFSVYHIWSNVMSSDTRVKIAAVRDIDSASERLRPSIDNDPS